MNKKLLFFLLFVLLGFAILFIWAVIYGFKVINPTTEEINRGLVKNFSKIVRVPEGIYPQTLTFDETIYVWEMETLQKEVITVRFKYNPAFEKSTNKITATLEMVEGGDASIFVKTLPALISDVQSLQSALDPKKADLAANQNVGYDLIELSLKPSTGQTIRISWDFSKTNVVRLETQYRKLAKFPTPLLKMIYSLPHSIIGFLAP